jgi:hypothetical protein
VSVSATGFRTVLSIIACLHGSGSELLHCWRCGADNLAAAGRQGDRRPVSEAQLPPEYQSDVTINRFGYASV